MKCVYQCVKSFIYIYGLNNLIFLRITNVNIHNTCIVTRTKMSINMQKEGKKEREKERERERE